jgi:hypothetical protein
MIEFKVFRGDEAPHYRDEHGQPLKADRYYVEPDGYDAKRPFCYIAFETAEEACNAFGLEY